MRLNRCRIVLALAALAALASSPAFAENEVCEPARPARVEDMSIDQLENMFWVCDYAATVGGVSATPASFCAVVTAELKKQKFGGDYEGLLDWWRLNKVAEYQKLDHK